MGDVALSPIEIDAAAPRAPLDLTCFLEGVVLNLAAVRIRLRILDLEAVAEPTRTRLPRPGRAGGKFSIDMGGVLTPVPGTVRVMGGFPILASVIQRLLPPQGRPKRHWGISMRVRLF